MHHLLAMKFLSQSYPGLSAVTTILGRSQQSGLTIQRLHFHSLSFGSLPKKFCFRPFLIQSFSNHNTFESKLVSLHMPTSMDWESIHTPSAFRQIIQPLPSGLETRSAFQLGRTCTETTLCTLSIVRQVPMVFSSLTRTAWTSRLRTMGLEALR